MSKIRSPRRLTPFMLAVFRVVKAIKPGGTLSYGEVATRAGHRGAARAVGNLMKSNYDPKIPCHRVIKKSGQIGYYNRGGSKQKAKLLKAEGLDLSRS